jgi:hypothetical protein
MFGSSQGAFSLGVSFFFGKGFFQEASLVPKDLVFCHFLEGLLTSSQSWSTFQGLRVVTDFVSCQTLLDWSGREEVPGNSSRVFLMRNKLAIFAAGVAMLLAAVPMVAHHSFAAEFDANKPFKFTGTVTKIEWMNPHAYFYVDVTDEGGKVVNWAMEMGSPNGLMRQGWTRNSMKVGDKVTVEGSKAKDGSNVGNARAVTMASTGQRLFAASSQQTTP